MLVAWFYSEKLIGTEFAEFAEFTKLSQLHTKWCLWVSVKYCNHPTVNECSTISKKRDEFLDLLWKFKIEAQAYLGADAYAQIFNSTSLLQIISQSPYLLPDKTGT